MTSTTPILPLFTVNFRRWVSAKGFALVAAAALLPALLTGAWVATHQADVAALEVTADRPDFVEGDAVNFTATFENAGGLDAGGFNGTLSLLKFTGTELTDSPLKGGASNTTKLPGLASGDRATATLSWTAAPGVYLLLAQADSTNDLAEKEEFNNLRQYGAEGATPAPFAVKYKRPAPDAGPKAPAGLGGANESATLVDAVVSDLSWTNAEPKAGENVTFTAKFTNNGPSTLEGATLTLRLSRAVGGDFRVVVPYLKTEDGVTLAAGESRTLTLAWPAREGVFWAEAQVLVPQDARDADAASNFEAKSVVVDPQVPPELVEAIAPLFKPYLEPPEKATIKEFYVSFLSFLHLRVLIPFIALFYAAGVLADERERGNLPYLLTRPVARWTIPVTKFAASFAVAATAVTAGLLVSYLLLFGTPTHDVGYLWTPVMASLLALVVYGAFFILLGVLVERPYLWGAVFVVGWETFAGLFVPWVKNLTLSHHLLNVIGQDAERGGTFTAWPLDQGLQWAPVGEGATGALLVVLGLAVAFLLASAFVMKRREFEI